MLENAKGISKELLEKFELDFESNKMNNVMQHAMSKTDINDIAYVASSKVGNYHQFSLEIKTLPATSQKASGRCWIFAACNVLREIVAKNCNMDNFELSQNYVAFFDKLEKVNFAFESMIDLIDKEIDDRVVQTIIRFPISDGGQWDMFKSLVKKYGVCPKNVMDETYASSNTRTSDMLLNNLVRQFSIKIRENKKEDLEAIKEEYLENAYKLLSLSFGTPIKEFDFEYVDKEKKYHLEKNLTPKSFYDKYISRDIDEYVSIVNAPTKDKPYFETYTVDYIGNVVEGNPITHLNLPLNNFKEAILRQMKDGEIVWFGSDCSKFADRQSGMWDPNQYDYESIFGFSTKMSKENMLDFSESAMNHAMCLTGVNLIDDKPTKWKIENSWGEDIAHKGYFTASDDWFNSFVFQAVVRKKYLTEEEKECLDKKPHHLNPWDPLGTLA